MSIKIQVEIGHEAAIRNKPTPEGFTHDWEIFVRGCNADIQHYVEKVVFSLHETFTKPRRVIKEPPYVVKESGYAGFNLPIEIYLKNGGEPKKIGFHYDLSLQPCGPAILNVQKETYVFHQPTDEFRMRLLKGGGTIVSGSSGQNENSRDNSIICEERGQLVDKPKLGGDFSRKHKMRTDDIKASHTFSHLFGPPINKTAKVSPELKNQVKSSPKSNITKSDKNPNDKSKSKFSPHKDKTERDKSGKDRDYEKKIRDEKRNKEKLKERDRSKDKISKRDKSPKRPSASPRRSPKRELSPKRVSPKRVVSPQPKSKLDDRSKSDDLNQKNKSKSYDSKVDKKLKKDKRDKTKDKDRDRKEHKTHREENKNECESKEIKPSIKEIQKPSKEFKEKDRNKEKISKYPDVKDDIKTDKDKNDKQEIGERHKHKHKKKDREKSKKEDKERDKDKERKHEKKSVSVASKAVNSKEEPIKVPQGELDKDVPSNRISNNTFTGENMHESSVMDKSSNPLKALMAELSDNDSSDSSNNSLDGSSLEASINKPNIKPGNIENKPVVESPKVYPVTETNFPIKSKTDGERMEKVKKLKKHKERHKSDKSPEKDGDRKRKRKSAVKSKEEILIEKTIDERPAKMMKVDIPEIQLDHKPEIKQEDVAKISPEYMCILRDLQQKIMTLQDNSDLQKVVQLIAETGQYEITRQTFDFDLCALDPGTVKRLQEFFATT